MIHSKRSLEGWLMIDHRASPGINRADLAPGFDAPVVPGGKLFESATMMCAHCNGMVILNPDRTRERGNCWKCDRYICDLCAATGECRPYMQYVDEMLALASKGSTNG